MLSVRHFAVCLGGFLFGCSGAPGDAPSEDSGGSVGSGGSALGGSILASGGAQNGGSGGQGFGGLGSGGAAIGGLSEPGTGGVDASGGEPPLGGTSAIGGASGGSASGGGASGGNGATVGGASAAGGAPPVEMGPHFPAPGSHDQCPDPSIRIRFTGRPTLGTSGSIKVFDANASSTPVWELKMSTAQVEDTIGGSSFKLPRPAYVTDDEAVFVLPSKGLSYGHNYYVIIEPGVVTGPGSVQTVFANPEDWQFSVAQAAPADRSKLRVALDGQGQYCSLQGALDAATSGSEIAIGTGDYFGVVYFKGKNDLIIRGDDRDATRLLGTNNNNLNPSTRGRALIGTEGTRGLVLENLTIHNQTPQDGSQAEALALLSCDQCVVRNSTVRSLQDTLLWSGRIYAEDLLIEGNVDYIWGTGTVYFSRVQVKTVGRKGYNVQARNPASNYGYVFVDSKLSSDAGISGDYLARIDVGAYPNSHVAYIDCQIGPHISPAGWLVTGTGSTAGLRFWEYRSRDASGNLLNTQARAAGSKQLNQSEADAMRDVAHVLGGWDPR